MCGIAGYIAADRTPLDWETVHKAVEGFQKGLLVRGRDDRGVALFSSSLEGRYMNVVEGTNIASVAQLPHTMGILAHARLSILDLSPAGHQPMQYKGHWISYNGEIYNFLEVRAELESLGHQFHSKTDTEVLLKGYLTWGNKVLDKLKGMFAFVIYHPESGHVFCARDRIGMKPFYYVKTDRGFLFASNVKSLILSQLYKASPNWEGLHLGLSFEGVLRPMTAFQNVWMLSPGYYMEGPVSKLKPVQYWDFPVGETLDISASEAKERLEEIICESVKATLISDVEVATLMSGGIDSTLMSAVASKLSPKIQAFTLSFDSTLSAKNEVQLASDVAQRYPIKHHIKEVNEQDLFESFEEMAKVSEEPVGNLEPHFPIAQMIAQHKLKVLLNGLGPDELLLGYGFAVKLAKYWPFIKWLAPLQSLMPNKGIFRKVHSLATRNPFALYCDLFSPNLFGKNRVFNTNVLPKIPNSYEAMTAHFPDYTQFADPYQAISYAHMKVYIGTHHNHTADQFLMQFGIEGRFPYLYESFVDFCFRLPAKYKIANGVGKVLIRDVASGYIPKACITSRKQGFHLPELEFVSSKSRHKLYEKIKALQKRDIVNPDLIADVLEKGHRSITGARQILYLANLELWHAVFIDSQCRDL